MSKPQQPTSKQELFSFIHTSYNQLEAFLNSLSVEQITTPGVNSTWSVKDNIAHLTAWLDYQSTRMEHINDAVEPPNPAPGQNTEDDINEYYYQKFKDLPLDTVQANFHTAYQRILTATENMSWEALNAPFPWDNNTVPVGAYVMGNTCAHFDEHRAIIQRWLDKQANAK